MTKREIERSMEPQSTAATAAGLADIGELTILLDLKYGSAAYVGTRAQLESEGVVPATTEWPEKFDTAGWIAGGIQFWLRRERPKGAKGPRRDFLNCDNWHLGIYPFNRGHLDYAIMRKAEDLRRTVYRSSDEGRMAANKLWTALQTAKEDERFQAFKMLVPGLIRSCTSAVLGGRHRSE
ncbi:hypothetical protein [Burkholderia vietnamiensis]|uniref:hypothetical protein n=1 Tax=Burkholderia vietnamiensis TaxID=60552 RepID=UPI0012DB4B5E|nr:hypothetical protein [Burkholderia vietnamiensis]